MEGMAEGAGRTVTPGLYSYRSKVPGSGSWRAEVVKVRQGGRGSHANSPRGLVANVVREDGSRGRLVSTSALLRALNAGDAFRVGE